MTDVNDPNPYASPSSSGAHPSPTPGPLASALEWSPTEAFEFGWNTMKREPMSILVFFVAILVGNALAMAGAVVNGVLSTQHDRELQQLGLVIYTSCALLGLPLSIWMQMGMTRYALVLARRQTAGLEVLFAGGSFWTFIGATLLMALGIMAGSLICIVPGIILALGWMFVAQLVVDRRLGVVEALGTSWRLTTGHKGRLFLFMLLGIVVVLLGELACCVGVFVALPITYSAIAYVYLKLCGEQPPPAVS